MYEMSEEMKKIKTACGDRGRAKKQTDKNERLEDALLKVALGYQVAEVTEEFSEVDGQLKLTKRKKTKKDVPPDLKAVQLLLSAKGVVELSDWTDEQLEEERQRLLKEIKGQVRNDCEK